MTIRLVCLILILCTQHTYAQKDLALNPLWMKIHFPPDKTIYLTRSLGEKGLEMLWQQLEFTNQEIPEVIINIDPFGFISHYENERGPSLQELLWAQARGIEYHHCFEQDGLYLDAENLLNPQINIDTQDWIAGEAEEYISLRDDPNNDGGIEDLNRLIKFIQASPAKTLLVHDWNGRQGVRVLKLAVDKLAEQRNSPKPSIEVWQAHWEYPLKLTNQEYQAYLIGPYDLSASLIQALREWPNKLFFNL